MNASIEKLYKYVKLEIENDFNNRAIIGGFRNILPSWESEARAEGISNTIIMAVTARLRDYHQLTPVSREEALMGLWKRIQRSSDFPVPDLFGTRPEAVPPAEPPLSKPISKPEAAAPVAEEPVSKTEESEQPAPPQEELPAPMKEVRKPKPARRRGYGIPQPTLEGEAAALEAPLTVISGIGPKTSESLARLGLHNLGDALYYFPRSYQDYAKMLPINRLMYGDQVTIIGAVEQVRLRPTRTGKKVVEAIISDGSGGLRVNWFNQPWLVNQLREAGNISLSGRVDQYLGRLVMTSPDWEPVESEQLHTGGIVPVYSLTEKITQKWLRRKLRDIVDYWAPRVVDLLPEAVRRSADLMPLSEALRQVHHPDSWEDLEEARHRLAFDEIFLLQVGVLRQRQRVISQPAAVIETPLPWLHEQRARLPYALTGAQERAVEDIRRDLEVGRPMNRLLQGDVGAGKTVVAALGVAMVARQGGQAALMAPTSILAEQHHASLLQLLGDEGGPLRADQIGLVVGSTPESEKMQIKERLRAGQVKLVIGTHALIEPDVGFENLQLVVIDEQHRFGVTQRAVLREKGNSPHLLVMTATPIPRSLALTVYGDLDVTVIDEMPPGRQDVGTYLLRPVERERAYSLIKREIAAGNQAFMIYPLVEQSDKVEALSAVEEHARLVHNVFPKVSLGLLHGRLAAEEKERVMADFRDRTHDILVSTSVVEVGVDIPNATVMVIEGANRFGLAQLHQFRGRVGRGDKKSYCLLIPDSDDEIENERLMAMTATNDGFALAEKDLAQRGPGEFLGTRQSGHAELRMASITDVALIEKARQEAHALIDADPDLQDEQNRFLSVALDRFWLAVEPAMN
jgi:ATP-dependent DNA helicase RecG